MASYEIAQQRARSLPEIWVMSKFYGACPKTLVGKNNKYRLDYVALKIIFLQRILKQILKAKGNINPGKNYIKWRNLSAGTVMKDQIIMKSDVVGSACYQDRSCQLSHAIRLEDNIVFQPTGQSESRQYLPGYFFAWLLIQRLSATFCLSQSLAKSDMV